MPAIYTAAGAMMGAGIAMTPGNGNWGAAAAIGLIVVLIAGLVDRFNS